MTQHTGGSRTKLTPPFILMGFKATDRPRTQRISASPSSHWKTQTLGRSTVTSFLTTGSDVSPGSACDGRWLSTIRYTETRGRLGLVCGLVAHESDLCGQARAHPQSRPPSGAASAWSRSVPVSLPGGLIPLDVFPGARPPWARPLRAWPPRARRDWY